MGDYFQMLLKSTTPGVEEQIEGKRMFQGPLRKQDWVDYPGEGELAWGFGWRRCHFRRAMDGQPSLISEKSGKDGCTQAPLGEKCTCPQLERPC